MPYENPPEKAKNESTEKLEEHVSQCRHNIERKISFDSSEIPLLKQRVMELLRRSLNILSSNGIIKFVFV